MDYKVPIDLVALKAGLESGDLAVKINFLNDLLIEDTISGEAVKIMRLPEGYSFHQKGNWEPCFIYTSHSIEHPLAGEEGWNCSVCGMSVKEKTDWCTCGADMRESNKMSTAARKALEELLNQL